MAPLTAVQLTLKLLCVMLEMADCEAVVVVRTVEADELTRAKNYIALGFPGEFEATSDITRRLEEVVIYRLPDDYFSTYVGGVTRVTSADVQRVARTYITPDRIAVVVVGDLKTIEPGIRALNLGPIHVVTADEIFGPAQ